MENEDFYALFRKHHPAPYFHFTDVPPVGNIIFERLTADNFVRLFAMFEKDSNPFTEKWFKSYESARQYAFDIENYAQFSPNHGGQDWYFKNVAGPDMGIVHLYDLSLETFAAHNKRCWIGFHTAPLFRRSGITFKVVQHFIQYIFAEYPQIDFIHAMTSKANVASQHFLLKNRFQQDFTERLSKEDYFFILSKSCLNLK